ncbi:MAG: hypothetical protein Q8Q09_10050 [Deltaproteobacteria bacterium]|nr:hypothetical protein [Deltaproteobacteria bacterium]
MLSLHTVHEEPNHALTVFGPVLICVWCGPLPHNAQRATAVLHQLKRMRSSSHRDKLLYVYVAGATSTFPDDDARRIVSGYLVHFDASVGIHEGDTLRASIVRSIVAGMQMMSKTRSKNTVVQTSEEAGRVLFKLAPELSAAQYQRAIDDTCALALAKR